MAPSSAPMPTDLIVAATICISFAASAACAHAWTKATGLKPVQLDDYALVFAGIGFSVFVSLLFVGANAGLGKHIATLSADALERASMYSNVLGIMFALTVFAAKIAILVQVNRTSGNRKQLIYWGVRVLVILNALLYVSMLVAYNFACKPSPKDVDTSDHHTCVSQNALIKATGSIDITSNVAILLFAVWGVSRLQLNKVRKTLFALVFGIGIFTCVASVCRVVWGAQVDTNSDFTVDIWPTHLWSLAEITSICYVACCPSFPALLQHLRNDRSVLSSPYPTWALNKYARVESTEHDRKIHLNVHIETRITRTSTPVSRSETPSTDTKTNTPLSRSRESSPGPFRKEISSLTKSLSPPSSRMRSPSPSSNTSLPHQPATWGTSRQHAPPTIHSSTSYPVSSSLGSPSLPVINPSSCLPSRNPSSRFNRSRRPSSHYIPSQHQSSITAQSERRPSCESRTTCVSPTQTEFSVGVVDDAVRMPIMPVYFATIKRTTDVRISNHTNHSSPVTFSAPQVRW